MLIEKPKFELILKENLRKLNVRLNFKKKKLNRNNSKTTWNYKILFKKHNLTYFEFNKGFYAFNTCNIP
jgi:hypothetical protein